MEKSTAKNPINTYINIVLLTLLMAWSFLIVKPFVTLIVWAIILAVALYPIYQKLLKLTKGKKKGLVTSLFILVLLALLITPTISLTSSLIDSGTELYAKFEEGNIKVPPPSADVQSWPVVGEGLYSAWSSASSDLENFIASYKDEIKGSLSWFFGSFTGLLGTVVIGLVALVIAGVFMSSADSGYKAGVQLANRLRPGRGVR